MKATNRFIIAFSLACAALVLPAMLGLRGIGLTAREGAAPSIEATARVSELLGIAGAFPKLGLGLRDSLLAARGSGAASAQDRIASLRAEIEGSLSRYEQGLPSETAADSGYRPEYGRLFAQWRAYASLAWQIALATDRGDRESAVAMLLSASRAEASVQDSLDALVARERAEAALVPARGAAAAKAASLAVLAALAAAAIAAAVVGSAIGREISLRERLEDEELRGIERALGLDDGSGGPAMPEVLPPRPEPARKRIENAPESLRPRGSALPRWSLPQRGLSLLPRSPRKGRLVARSVAPRLRLLSGDD